jgi:hypothetical protein
VTFLVYVTFITLFFVIHCLLLLFYVTVSSYLNYLIFLCVFVLIKFIRGAVIKKLNQKDGERVKKISTGPNFREKNDSVDGSPT